MVNQGRRYRVLGPVGRGSFGTVYRAEFIGEGGFSKVVALKLLNPDIDQMGEVASRLRDEARVLGLVRHRAIVQVDGLVLLDGRWAVVMEYVEGVDLRKILARGKIPVGPTIEIVAETAGALHVAYSGTALDGRGLHLLHRDIKPSNIQITNHGEVKVLDFGVARADFKAREAETRSLVFGSMGYMSPERLDFIDGPEGDIYALGAVLFEALTGTRFGKTSAKESRHRARLMEALDRVWQDIGGVNEDLVRLVESMMAYEPDDRPSAREVVRMCDELWRQVGREPLRDWAEHNVPPIMEAALRDAKPDQLTGSILMERLPSEEVDRSGSDALVNSSATLGASFSSMSDTGSVQTGLERTSPETSGSFSGPLEVLDDQYEEEVTDPATELAALPHERGSRTIVGFAFALSLLAVGILVVMQLVKPGSDPVVQSDPAPLDLMNPDGGVPDADLPKPNNGVLQLQPEPEPEPEPPVEPVVEEPPETAPAPRPPRPRPRTRPRNTSAAAKMGTVKINRDAETKSVRLEGGGGSFPAGSVPAGDYTIKADFGDGKMVVAGEVTVTAGSTVSLNCMSVFTKCSP